LKELQQTVLVYKRRKGEITIFLSLICLVVISFIGALIISVKKYTTESKIEALSDLVTRSVFSEYDKALFENYGLLFIDTTYRGNTEGGTDCLLNHVAQYVDANLSEDDGLHDITYLSSNVSDVVYASDNNNQAIRNQITEYMIVSKGYDESNSEKDLIIEYMRINNILPDYIFYEYIEALLSDEDDEYLDYDMYESGTYDYKDIYEKYDESELIKITSQYIEEKMGEEHNSMFDFDNLINSANIYFYYETNESNIYECSKQYSFTALAERSLACFYLDSQMSFLLINHSLRVPQICDMTLYEMMCMKCVF